MKAVQIHQYGGPEVLRVESVPIPEVSPGEVLIQVEAAGVNPADWKLRRGLFRERQPVAFPHIPGTEVSGTVVQVGSLVSRVGLGDHVIARTESAYAEYVIAKADVV